MPAALLGRLVLSTVHTDDALCAIERLIDFSVPPQSLGATLRGVLSQCFDRRLCKSCSGSACEQARLANDVDLIAAWCVQSQIQCAHRILCPHVRTEFPRSDIAAVIAQGRTEIKPAPAQNLEVSEVRLRPLVDGGGLVFELTGGFDHDEGWVGDQISSSSCSCFVLSKLLFRTSSARVDLGERVKRSAYAIDLRILKRTTCLYSTAKESWVLTVWPRSPAIFIASAAFSSGKVPVIIGLTSMLPFPSKATAVLNSS